jgi:hypothetical protein
MMLRLELLPRLQRRAVARNNATQQGYDGVRAF